AVEVWAENDADARTLASQIRIDAGGGLIRATGPDTNGFLRGDRDEGWAVSLEVFTPWNTDLKLQSHNGSMNVSDIRGRIELQAHNGAMHLARVAGDVRAETHNGAIQAELQGNNWEGRQLELNSYNGGVTLAMPPSYSASLETHSLRGRVSSDF